MSLRGPWAWRCIFRLLGSRVPEAAMPRAPQGQWGDPVCLRDPLRKPTRCRLLGGAFRSWEWASDSLWSLVAHSRSSGQGAGQTCNSGGRGDGRARATHSSPAGSQPWWEAREGPRAWGAFFAGDGGALLAQRSPVFAASRPARGARWRVSGQAASRTPGSGWGSPSRRLAPQTHPGVQAKPGFSGDTAAEPRAQERDVLSSWAALALVRLL